MTGSVALDVVIGLVFIYLLYSLFATTLAEIIATNLGFRARNLLAAIDRMLTDQKTPGDRLVGEIDTPTSKFIIYTKGFFKWALDSKPVALIIEFIIRLYFIVIPYKSGLTKKFFDSAEIKYQGRNSFFKTPSYISKESFSKALLDILKTGRGDTDVERIQNYLNDNQNGDTDTHNYILSLLSDGQNDLQKFKNLLENWFERMMERATGWYKRQIQLVLLILGFAIASGFNASTFRIVKVLSTDKDARTQMVQMSSAYIQSHKALENNDPKTNQSLDSLKAMQQKLAEDMANANSVLGLGWVSQESAIIFCLTKLIKKEIRPCKKVDPIPIHLCDPCNEIKKIVNDTLFIKQDTVCIKKDSVKYKDKYIKNIYYSRTDHYILIPRHADKDLFLANLKIKYGVQPQVEFNSLAYFLATVDRDWLGYLITAIAISLGAPFWFDLLSKLTQLRGSVQQITQHASGSPQKNDPSSPLNREG